MLFILILLLAIPIYMACIAIFDGDGDVVARMEEDDYDV